MMNTLRVSMIQSGIAWEDKAKNRQDFERLLAPLKGVSDLAVLPEMFTTGFSMNIQQLAESDTCTTVHILQQWAKSYDLAIAGSFPAKEADGRCFNRGFFITPEGETYFSDKRHLFRLSEEPHFFTSGQRYSVIPYKGWNIRLIICYDLRFPVWMRNTNNEYDLLLCVANWPQSRANVWNVLLQARAIENLCYVGGVNRTGTDGHGIVYQGESAVVDYKGNRMAEAGQQPEAVITAALNKDKLQDFRNKFPAWKDADSFIFLP
jgi:predicted amidohydrolase